MLDNLPLLQSLFHMFLTISENTNVATIYGLEEFYFISLVQYVLIALTKE